MIGITLWPVFLVQLRDVWELSNSQIGWISGAYFVGYVVDNDESNITMKIKLNDLYLDNFKGVNINAKRKPINIAVIDTAIVIKVA